MAALDGGVPLRDVQIATRHADPHNPPSTTGVAGTSTGTPPTWSWRSWPAADTRDQTRGGSIRSIVLTRSIDRSKEATLPTPVVSAQATRYASAKSIRS